MSSKKQSVQKQQQQEQQDDLDYNDEQEEVLICTQCGQQVENILDLQCKHDLCLDCATKNINPFVQENLQQNKIQCEICSLVTVIDPNSFKQLINYAKMKQNFQQSASKSQISNSKLEQTKYQQNMNFLQQQKFFEKDQQKENLNNINNNSSKKALIAQADDDDVYYTHFCKDHPTEEAVLFCFSCLCSCICVECYINGSHKTHDVRNVKKSVINLQQMVSELTYKLKSQTEFLLEDEVKLQQKKKELVETVTDGKQKINTQFQDLYEKIEKKQKEMMGSLDEFLEDKFTEIDLTLSKVKQQLEILQQNEQQLNYFCVFDIEKENNQKDEIIGFNYYAENKSSINQLLNKIETNLFDQISPKLNQKFCLDLQSAHYFVQQIRDIKVEVLSLRGVDGYMPTSKEQYFYELAKEEQFRTKYQHHQNQSMSKNRGSPFQVTQNNNNNYSQNTQENSQEQLLQQFQQKQQQITEENFNNVNNFSASNLLKQDEDLQQQISKLNDSKTSNSWLQKYERLFKKQQI